MNKLDVKYFPDLEAMSKLSTVTYKGNSILKLPADWISLQSWENKDTGFYAVAYKKGDNVIISVAGSDEPIDYWEDFKMAFLNKEPKQMKDFDAFIKNLNKIDEYKNCNIFLLGHSLGGSECQIYSVKTGIPALTINAYGTGDILQAQGYGNLQNANIINFGHNKDVVFLTNYDKHPGTTYVVRQDSHITRDSWGNIKIGSKEIEIPNLTDLDPRNRLVDEVRYRKRVHGTENIGDLSDAVSSSDLPDKHGYKENFRNNVKQPIRNAVNNTKAGLREISDVNIENAARQSQIEVQQGEAIFTKAKEVASDAKALASSFIKKQSSEEYGRAIAQAFQQSKVAPVESISVNDSHVEKALKIIEKTTNPQNQQESDEVKASLQKLSEVRHITKHELNNCVQKVSNKIKNENAQRAQQGQPLKTSKDVLIESVYEIVKSSEATARGKRMAESVNIKTNFIPQPQGYHPRELPEKASVEGLSFPDGEISSENPSNQKRKQQEQTKGEKVVSFLLDNKELVVNLAVAVGSTIGGVLSNIPFPGGSGGDDTDGNVSIDLYGEILKINSSTGKNIVEKRKDEKSYNGGITGGDVHVKGYIRSDGAVVDDYYRSRPGC